MPEGAICAVSVSQHKTHSPILSWQKMAFLDMDDMDLVWLVERYSKQVLRLQRRRSWSLNSLLQCGHGGIQTNRGGCSNIAHCEGRGDGCKCQAPTRIDGNGEASTDGLACEDRGNKHNKQVVICKV